MEQLSDVTYRDVRWRAPPALAGVPLGQGGVAEERAPRAGGRVVWGHVGPAWGLPARGGPERRQKHRNTVSRWDGGAGLPGQDVTAAGRTV